MLAIDTKRHQAELAELLGGLSQDKPNWHALDRQTSHFAQDIELYDVFEQYGPGEPLRTNSHEPLFQNVRQLELAVSRRDKQGALQYAESVLRALDRIK